MNLYNQNTFYVYILTNWQKNVLYIGVTNNLNRRLKEHREEVDHNSFTFRYKVFYLIYFEQFDNAKDAINRETQLKKWNREKKDNLINSFNPERRFLDIPA